MATFKRPHPTESGKEEVVEAFKFLGEIGNPPGWFEKARDTGIVSFVDPGTPDMKVTIKTPDCKYTANIGDYIVFEKSGDICVIPPAVFEQQFTKAEV